MNQYPTFPGQSTIRNAENTCVAAILSTLGVTATKEQREEISTALLNFVVGIDDARKEAAMRAGIGYYDDE